LDVGEKDVDFGIFNVIINANLEWQKKCRFEEFCNFFELTNFLDNFVVFRE
jgi:hypothetical protein